MKLFHKFFVALLLISLVPLIVYSIILVNTTGLTLKRVIDRNNENTLGNVVIEMNKYFVEVEDELNLARRLERSPSAKSFEKTNLIMSRVSQSRVLWGVSVLDQSLRVLTGMAKNSVAPGMDVDKKLVARASASGEVEMGRLSAPRDGPPTFDLVYPMSTAPQTFCYFRMSVEPVLKRLNAYMHRDEAGAGQEIILLDGQGGAAGTGPLAGKVDATALYEKYGGRDREKIFSDGGYVRAVSRTGGPGWLVVFSEPEAAAYSAITALKIGSAVLIIFSAGLALAGAFTLAGGLAKPISTLVSGMEIVSKGNLGHRVPEGATDDELSQLASFFNSMTEKLKGLQEEVKRTERLSTIGQMSNIIGHEIRNPLSAIRNATYLIKLELSKRQDVDPKLLQRVDIIESEIKATNKIINDMLDFSRARQPVVSKHDLNSLIKEVLDETPPPQNVGVELKLGEAPKVSMDVDEIRQVLRNLINNSVDAMKASGGTLTLRTGQGKMDRHGTALAAVFVEVSDTGAGINAEDMKKIFEPFFSTKAKGTGLGLAVVKRVVEERHNGTITAASEAGKGSAFTVKLPAA